MNKTDRYVYKITQLIYPEAAGRVEVGESLLLLKELVEFATSSKMKPLAKAAVHLGLTYQQKVKSDFFADHLESALFYLDQVSKKGYEQASDEIDQDNRGGY
jgi:hypothetical protein